MVSGLSKRPLAALLFLIVAADVEAGQTLFEQRCAACHSIGGGRMVGPDLAGVHERRSAEWLRKFIRDSRSLIDAGDPDAVALFETYKIGMPPMMMSDAEIDAVVGHIASASGGASAAGTTPAAPPAEPARVATAADVKAGSALFDGTQRLTNRGAACSACHHVRSDAVIGGGTLARDLTDAFSRLSSSGLSNVIGRPPFPVMQQAYADKPLSEDEVFALVAFLQDADRNQQTQPPLDYGVRMFVAGAGGMLVLNLLAGVVWIGRRRRSVYQDIYDRQVRSE